MTTWKRYPSPDKDGEYAEIGRLFLVAYSNGQWAVWCTGSGGTIKPRASGDGREFYTHPCKNMEQAKKRAMEVADEMISNG